MTCPACRDWCATTEAQLLNRAKSISSAPYVRMHPCPHCGGTDWATSREMIEEEETARVSAWRTLDFWQKWMPVFNFALAIVCGASVFFSGPTWSGVVNAFVAGISLAGGVYSLMLRRSHVIHDEMLTTMKAVHEMNRALLTEKVEVVMTHVRIGRDDDDDTPIAPEKMN